MLAGTLKTLIDSVAPGESVKQLCEKGDQLLLDETAKVMVFLGFLYNILPMFFFALQSSIQASVFFFGFVAGLQVFKKEKEIKKGIAFPTCLSVNNCICHFSPTKNDQDYELKENDVVKIDLGAHIDGK